MSHNRSEAFVAAMRPQRILKGEYGSGGGPQAIRPFGTKQDSSQPVPFGSFREAFRVLLEESLCEPVAGIHQN
jgi:hypothetical protein